MPPPKPDNIFCLVRKKWVKRTPEEEVRQALVHYLSWELGYPIGLMALEYFMVVNDRPVRCDIVVFNRHTHTPLLVIECKAGYVALTEKVLDQIVRYNLGLKVPHMLISNGQSHVFYSWDNTAGKLITRPNIMSYADLIS